MSFSTSMNQFELNTRLLENHKKDFSECLSILKRASLNFYLFIFLLKSKQNVQV